MTPNTVTVDYFNTPLTNKQITQKQKLNGEIHNLNDIMISMDQQLSAVHSKQTIKNTHSFQTPMHLSISGHTLGHRAHLRKYRITEITLCILSDHKIIKLDSNNRNVSTYTNWWKLSYTLLNDGWIKRKIRRAI